MLGEATRQLVEWDDRTDGGPKPTIAVNISGRHLADPRVAADVADALAASGLSPSRLVLEVTETVLVDDPAAIGHLSELRDRGVGVAIDDFGTGYTSIGQLGSMPVAQGYLLHRPLRAADAAALLRPAAGAQRR